MRLTYVDNIKGLGIILVILYHCGYVPFDSLLIRGVYAMCVPLFFMVNGYLMLRKEHSIRSLLLKNLKILLIIVFWAFVSTAVYMLKCGDWQSHSIMECSKILLKNSALLTVPYCNHLWFLKAIIALNILNPIIYYFIHYKRNGVYYLLILSFICTTRFLNLIIGESYNPFMSYNWFSLLYYILGYALLDGHLKTNILKTWHIWLMIFVLILCQRGYNWLLTEGFFASKKWITDVVWEGYNAPFVIFLTAATCLLFQRINWRENSWIQHIGKYSLPIYLMQTPIQRLWQMALPLDYWKQCSHALGIILPLLTLISCCIIARLMCSNRYTSYIVKI